MKTSRLLFLLSLSASVALAGPPSPASHDKSGYSLFHPTPDSEMRDMTTDRPDQTESPFTVDAGHFQIEMDLVNWTHDRSGGAVTDTIAIAPVNFKMGLTDSVDLQLVYDSYTEERTRAGGHHSRAGGWGDLTARLKINLWGNEGSDTAFGLLPFIKIPTGSRSVSNGEVEGGLILPFAITLSKTVGLGVMTEVDILANDSGGGHHLAWVNSASVSYNLTKKLGAYTEFFCSVSDDGAPWVGQFDAGLTYGLTDNVQLDCGCNFGLTRSAPDYQPFVGVSFRF
jgi:hypothetical protein